MDVVPIVPIAQFQLHDVLSPRVRGFVLTSTGSFDASVVWLTDARRASG